MQGQCSHELKSAVEDRDLAVAAVKRLTTCAAAVPSPWTVTDARKIFGYRSRDIALMRPFSRYKAEISAHKPQSRHPLHSIDTPHGNRSLTAFSECACASSFELSSAPFLSAYTPSIHRVERLHREHRQRILLVRMPLDRVCHPTPVPVLLTNAAALSLSLKTWMVPYSTPFSFWS